MNILYLGRLEFPIFVQMEKKSDALVVLLENKQTTKKEFTLLKTYKYEALQSLS